MFGKLLVAATVSIAATLFTSGSATHAGSHIVTRQAHTGPYHLVLKIGAAEAMHMNGKKGAGEQMLGGAMATCDMSMAGMSMGKTCNHHAELHITRTADGQVMTRAHVTITLVNNDTHTVIHVPIMTMAGAEGKRDFHYGNNVYAPPGSYTVYVWVNNVRTEFSVRLT
ncbi:MAG: hypothetical protein NVS4B2_09390 [Chloroflexota bacterium]